MNPASAKVPISGSVKDPPPSSELTGLRWFARISGLLIGGFFLFMFIGEALQNRPPGSILQIKPMDAALFLLGTLYGVGLLVALRWERQGTLLSLYTLIGFHLYSGLNIFLARGLAAALYSPRGLFNPGILVFWFPVVLYLVCLNLAAKARKRVKA